MNVVDRALPVRSRCWDAAREGDFLAEFPTSRGGGIWKKGLTDRHGLCYNRGVGGWPPADRVEGELAGVGPPERERTEQTG